RHAAGVEVALLPEAADLADAGTGRHRHHGRVRRVVLRRQRELPLGRGRAAQRADLAVGPGLLGDPAQGVVAVGLRIAEDLVLALAEVAAALVLDDEGVAAAHRLDGVADGAAARNVLVVRRLPQDRGHVAARVLRAVDVGR